MQTQRLENSYALSTASILDQATISQAFAWGISDHIEVANSTGYNGVELWPQRMRGRTIRADLLSDRNKKRITSVHQSVGRPILQANSLREIQTAVFLPTTIDSLPQLEQIRRHVGDLPVVLKYMPKTKVENVSYSQKGIQTEPELCLTMNVTNAEDYVAGIKEMGYSHIVVDTHHIRRPHSVTNQPNPLANWKETLPGLLLYTNEIHIGVGRTDYGNLPKQQILDETQDLLNGGEKNTELMQMLRFVADSGWRGLVVVELRPSAILNLQGRRRLTRQLPQQELVAAYENIRETLFQTFDK